MEGRKSHQILTEDINEVVVTFVQTLCLNTDKQAAKIAELEERVKSLEDQTNKNSRDSSKPPSTDTIRKTRSQRRPSGKPVGGQKGHKGHTLEMAEKPDQFEHQAESKICPNCGCLNKAIFPKEVAYPVQYGTRLKAVATYLNQYQLVPFDRLSEAFVDLFSHR